MHLPDNIRKCNVRHAAAVLLLLTALAGVYAGYCFCSITAVEFVGIGMTAEMDRRFISGNLIFFPSQKLKKEMLEEYHQLKDVVITKRFPHTLVIQPLLRDPIALVVTPHASYGIDSDGIVTGIITTLSGAPLIHTTATDFRIGRAVKDNRIAYALQFIRAVREIFAVSDIQISDDGTHLKARGESTEIVFSQNQSMDSLIATLQTLLPGIRIKGTMPKSIDVRFTKPVVTW